MKSALTLEKKQDYPILIVDKTGYIGEALADKLNAEALIVLVSGKTTKNIGNTVTVPFDKKIPTIPDNTYSYIFLIDEKGELTKETLDVFVKKAEDDSSYLVVAINHKSVSRELAEKIISSYSKIRLVILGDIFAKNYIYEADSDINNLILEIKKTGKIIIKGDGTKETFSVFFDDVVNGLLDVVFKEENKNNLFFLSPKHKIMLLSLAHMFHKKNPQFKLDFEKEKKSEQADLALPSEGIYLLGDAYDLEEKIKQIDLEGVNIKEVKKAEPAVKEKRGRGFGFAALFISAIFLLVLPLITTLFFSFTGATSLYKVKTDFENGNFSSSKTSVIFAQKSFASAAQTMLILTKEADFLGLGSRVEGLSNEIALGQDVSNAALSLADASDKLKAVLSNTSKNPAADFSYASSDLRTHFLFTIKKNKKT